MSYRRVAHRYAYKRRVARLVKRYISAKAGDNKTMVKFLTKVNLCVGEFMEKVSDDEMKEIGDEI